jgi:hypothetical protein
LRVVSWKEVIRKLKEERMADIQMELTRLPFCAIMSQWRAAHLAR